jgi:regulatory protein
MLKKILQKKTNTISEKDPYKKRYLLTRYASSKGYESDLIADLLINNKLD